MILFARINLLYLLLFSLYRQMQNKRYKQGNSFPYVIFSWCQMCQNFFDYLLPTDIVYCFKYNVILCQLFFQQTGAVKTLPQHNPISLTLSCFFLQIPMNSQFDLFTLTEFLFSSNKERSTNNIFTLQFDLNNKIVTVV